MVKYERPSMEIVEFEQTEVITTSLETKGPLDGFGDGSEYEYL